MTGSPWRALLHFQPSAWRRALQRSSWSRHPRRPAFLRLVKVPLCLRILLTLNFATFPASVSSYTTSTPSTSSNSMIPSRPASIPASWARETTFHGRSFADRCCVFAFLRAGSAGAFALRLFLSSTTMAGEREGLDSSVVAEGELVAERELLAENALIGCPGCPAGTAFSGQRRTSGSAAARRAPVPHASLAVLHPLCSRYAVRKTANYLRYGLAYMLRGCADDVLGRGVGVGH